jgi:hypothetical protein
MQVIQVKEQKQLLTYKPMVNTLKIVPQKQNAFAPVMKMKARKPSCNQESSLGSPQGKGGRWKKGSAAAAN